jgi:hypothetical protein
MIISIISIVEQVGEHNMGTSACHDSCGAGSPAKHGIGIDHCFARYDAISSPYPMYVTLAFYGL